MTSAEARIFLNADAYEDITDAYEQTLFDQKQYFLLKPCIPKVDVSKMERLKLYHEASTILGLEVEANYPAQQILFSEASLIEFHRSYWEQLNHVKKLISSVNGFDQLRAYAYYRYQLFCEYASKWPFFTEFKEGLLLSSEPDPMLFFEELKQLESNGISTFASLVESDVQLGLLVKKESTRLHLVYNSK